MSEAPIPTPFRMWRALSDDQKMEAARAFWADDDLAAEHAEAVALVAKQINFRLKSVQALAADRKARHLATLPRLPDTLAARLLIVYHLTSQRPMMQAFLDALDIPHEDGLITEESVKAPDPKALAKAAAKLREEFPPDAVSRYFATLTMQDPATWGGLEQELTGAAKAPDQ